ncbi:MAG: gliding motility-associated C-terminal domain-containing protein [Flavobacteriales bacterium]|nr:gliding motility-associated C-terminal domain-containing protein [Flavobacteriales bacterium]
MESQCIEPSYVKILGTVDADVGHAMDISDDGIYAIATTPWEGAGNIDLLLMHLDFDFQLIWSVTIGSSSEEGGTNAIVKVLDDGSIAFSGYTITGGDRDIVLGRVSSSGTLLWSVVKFTGIDDTPRDLIQLEDGNLLLGGTVNSLGFGSSDAFLAKFTIDGTLLWARNYGGNINDHFYSLSELSDGNILCVGNNESWGSNFAGWVVKVDQDGDVLDQNILNGSGVDSFLGSDLGPDGSIYLNMRTETYDSEGDMLMAKLDQNLNLLWQKRLVSDPTIEWGTEVHYTPGGIIFSGNTQISGTNALVNIVLSPDGEFLGSSYLNFTSSESFQIISQITDYHNGVYYGVFSTTSFGGDSDIGFAKFDGCELQLCSTSSTPVIQTSTLSQSDISSDIDDFSGFVNWSPTVTGVDITDFAIEEPCGNVCITSATYSSLDFCQQEPGFLEVEVETDSEVLEIAWEFDDGSVQFGNSIEVTFPEAGEFEVVVSIETLDPSCSYSEIISITVEEFLVCNPDCITIESALIPEFCVGQMDTLSVLIISESPVTQVSWIFEDGSVFPGNEVYVDFDTPGPVNVQLWIETENVLCYYDETYVINVLSEEECLPDCNTDITWEVDTFCVGVSDSLAVLVTSDAAVQSILWILPDGTTLEGNPVEVTFPDAGPVEVEVQVLTDLSSCDVYESIIVDVSDEGPCDMECITSIEPLWSTVCADSLQLLELNITSESEVISVEWTFEDGTVLTGNPVDYEFTNLGVEEIALFVTTSDTLCNLQEILNIEVYDPDSCFGDCETSLNYSIPDPCAGEEIVCSVDVTSNADITGIVWNMPDDGAYEGDDIVYTFSEPGSYAVQVIVTTDPPQCGFSQWIQVEVSEVEATSPVVVPVCDEFWPIAASELPFTSADGTWEELDLNNPDFEPEEGDYTFMLNTFCGPVAQLVSLVNVGPCDCAPMWIPNVFTPDKDAFNETWYPVFASPPVWCEIVVWSRWGLEVFRTNEWDERWIGNHQGGTHYVQPDVYYFIVKYQCREGEPIRSEAGHVTVLR